MEGVQVRDPLVRHDEQLVVGLLQDGHPLAVDLELLSVEPDLGLPALLNVALELRGDKFRRHAPMSFAYNV